jgi:hypothetical protein
LLAGAVIGNGSNRTRPALATTQTELAAMASATASGGTALALAVVQLDASGAPATDAGSRAGIIDLVQMPKNGS